MKRRDFILKSISAGLMAGMYNTLQSCNTGGQTGMESEFIDQTMLAAVKGGEPDDMFDKAIEAMGGMGKFVKKNQSVVVKPNIGWIATPERAANTNPILVKRIVEHCLNAGASKVYVFDHTCQTASEAYKQSGIERAVKEAGGTMVFGNAERYYQDVDVPKGKSLTKTKVHELIFESDVFINVPILKNHGSADLTIAMKNLMGIIWDRRWWHKNDLHQCIADFSTFERMPDLNVVDAYRVMTKNGPQGVSAEDAVIKKSLLMSTDIVAADAAAAKLFGTQPEKVEYIATADEMKIGEKDLENIEIKRMSMD